MHFSYAKLIFLFIWVKRKFLLVCYLSLLIKLERNDNWHENDFQRGRKSFKCFKALSLFFFMQTAREIQLQSSTFKLLPWIIQQRFLPPSFTPSTLSSSSTIFGKFLWWNFKSLSITSNHFWVCIFNIAFSARAQRLKEVRHSTFNDFYRSRGIYNEFNSSRCYKITRD